MAHISMAMASITKKKPQQLAPPSKYMKQLEDYEFEFAAYDDDGNHYFLGYCDNEDMEEIFDFMKDRWGVTELRTRKNVLKTTIG